MKINYQEYLRSPQWKAIREWALERAERRCQLCNSGKKLNVHHRSYDRLGHEWPADLTVLCHSCHEKHHDKIQSPPMVRPGPHISIAPGPPGSKVKIRMKPGVWNVIRKGT